MNKRESEDHEIKSFRESIVYPLMPILKKGILHRTGLQGYKGIKQSGHIEPNLGQFPYSYPQSKTYYGGSNGFICLFDFESAEEEDYRAIHLTWGQFLTDHKPITIIMRLNRQKLVQKLIPNSDAPKIGDPKYRSYIPYVETWYPEPIPLSAVENYIVTFWNRDADKIEFQEFTSEDLIEFEKLLNLVEKL